MYTAVVLLSFFLFDGTISEKSLDRDNYKYERALEAQKKNHKPILIFIGAKWCVACSSMKTDTLKPMRDANELDSVNIVVLDADFDKDLVKELTSDLKPIQYPCTILFTENKKVWKKLSVVGRQTKDKLKEFIKRSSEK